VAAYIRKVRTASGATAVQIAAKHGRRDKVLEHLGSAHTDSELAALLATPGRNCSPWNNGFMESSNNRLRDECVNRNYWPTLLEARVVIEDFKDDHDHRDRQSALG